MTSTESVSDLVMLETSKQLNTVSYIIFFDEFFENWNFFTISSDDEVGIRIMLKYNWNDID